jgi:hypothetical protein
MCNPDAQAQINKMIGGPPEPPGVAPFYASQTMRPADPGMQSYLPRPPGGTFKRWSTLDPAMDDEVNGAVNNDSVLGAIYGGRR